MRTGGGDDIVVIGIQRQYSQHRIMAEMCDRGISLRYFT
jgi:hypothetical protein